MMQQIWCGRCRDRLTEDIKKIWIYYGPRWMFRCSFCARKWPSYWDWLPKDVQNYIKELAGFNKIRDYKRDTPQSYTLPDKFFEPPKTRRVEFRQYERDEDDWKRTDKDDFVPFNHDDQIYPKKKYKPLDFNDFKD